MHFERYFSKPSSASLPHSLIYSPCTVTTHSLQFRWSGSALSSSHDGQLVDQFGVLLSEFVSFFRCLCNHLLPSKQEAVLLIQLPSQTRDLGFAGVQCLLQLLHRRLFGAERRFQLLHGLTELAHCVFRLHVCKNHTEKYNTLSKTRLIIIAAILRMAHCAA